MTSKVRRGFLLSEAFISLIVVCLAINITMMIFTQQCQHLNREKRLLNEANQRLETLRNTMHQTRESGK